MRTSEKIILSVDHERSIGEIKNVTKLTTDNKVGCGGFGNVNVKQKNYIFLCQILNVKENVDSKQS